MLWPIGRSITDKAKRPAGMRGVFFAVSVLGIRGQATEVSGM
jgi:hypothetical protein